MCVVTARAFRANQKKYFELAEQEPVYVSRKNRRPMVIRVADDLPKRDLTAELVGAL